MRIDRGNLGLRFLLEVAALGALAYWGWAGHSGVLPIVFTIGVPLLAGALWATVRVPEDGGEPLVAVPGTVRLGLEVGLFAIAVILLSQTNRPHWAVALGGAVAIHYLLDHRRVRRLLTA